MLVAFVADDNNSKYYELLSQIRTLYNIIIH